YSVHCEPNVMPSAETCDGVDNDCDGTIDNGDPGGGGACDTGLPGVCKPGTSHCVNATTVCQPNAQASTEVCNGIDDNCDGKGDDGVMGVVLGGPAPTNLHGFYWATSPAFDTSKAVGTVYLSFWRWLNSDYDPYMHNKVQVSSNNGATWNDLPYGTTGGCCGV